MKIGVFDSGIGGLSIAVEVKRLLPSNPILYFADSAFAPYGELSETELLDRCTTVVNKLVEHGCELIVVACNTATVNCINKLRAQFSIPFVGVEPGLKPAVSLATRGVSLMATARTLKSFHHQSKKLDFDIPIHDIACVGLADWIESLHQNQTSDLYCLIQSRSGENRDHSLLEHYLAQLTTHQSDVLVLGCTHYSLVKAAIGDFISANGLNVQILDTARAVASQVLRVSVERSNLAGEDHLLGQNAIVRKNGSDVEDKTIFTCVDDEPVVDQFISSGNMINFVEQLNFWLQTPFCLNESLECHGSLPVIDF